MEEEDLQDLYAWIDEIPLSRQKRNISRDFSDAVLVAEVVNHFVPRLVEMHNYQPANSIKQKLANWHTLQHKVFRKLDLTVPENVLQGVVSMKPGVVEVVLNNLRLKIQQYLAPPSLDVLDRVATDLNGDGLRGGTSGGDGAVNSSGSSGRRRRLDRDRDREVSHLSVVSDGRGRSGRSGRTGGSGRTGAMPPIGKARVTKISRQRDSPKMAAGGRLGRVSGRTAGAAVAGPAQNSPLGRRGGGNGGALGLGAGAGNDTMALEEELIESRETIEILNVKVNKLEQLLGLKDRKIEELTRMLMEYQNATVTRKGGRGYR